MTDKSPVKKYQLDAVRDDIVVLKARLRNLEKIIDRVELVAVHSKID